MIARRLFGISVFIVFLSGAVVSALFMRHAGRIIQDQVERRGRILLQAVVKQALDSMRRGDFDAGLDGVVRSLKQDPDVDIAIVVDSDGNILAHSNAAKKGSKLFLSLWDQDVMKSSTPKIRYDKENARYIIGVAIQGPRSFQEGGVQLSMPTGASAISLGAVYVGLSQAKIERQIQKTMVFTAASLAVMVLIAAVLVTIFTKRSYAR